MSGAVEDVYEKVTDIGLNNPIMKAIGDIPILGELKNSVNTFNQSGANVIKGIRDGKSAGQIIAGSAKPFVDRGKSLAGPVISEIRGDQEAAAPLSIVADDPAAVAADAEKKKAQAKRKAEVDIMTGQPGRGGTILTDQYTYNV